MLISPVVEVLKSPYAITNGLEIATKLQLHDYWLSGAAES